MPEIIPRTSTDSIALGDTVTRIGTLFRTTSDSVSLADVASAVVNPGNVIASGQAIWIE